MFHRCQHESTFLVVVVVVVVVLGVVVVVVAVVVLSQPANIFLTLDGTVKVGDLGLGRMFSADTVQAFSKVRARHALRTSLSHFTHSCSRVRTAPFPRAYHTLV